MSQLRSDLQQQIRKRFVQVFADAVDLYEMANLSTGDATEDIFYVLISELAYGLNHYDVPPKEAATVLFRIMQLIKHGGGEITSVKFQVKSGKE